MKRRSKLQIQETVEELKELLKHQTTAVGLERIQALYLFQTGQIKTVTGIAKALGKDRTTIQRWWQKYQSGGLDTLLGRKNLSPGRKATIPPEVLKALSAKLTDEKGFKTYEQVRRWLATAWDIKAAYSVVYKATRYRLQAKLKVPRPQSVKQDQPGKENF